LKATIVTIGDEILIGQVTDTNSGYIASALEQIGVRVHEMISVSDDRQHILDTFARLQDSVDLILVTGGLGPTKDDITKKTFCDYFGDKLIVDQKVLQHVTAMYENVFKQAISQVNKDQALVPSQAVVFQNDLGSAPGMWMQKGNTIFISMPGVPYEMKAILDNHVVPRIIQTFERPHILHRTVMTYGMPESQIAAKIEGWENALPDFIKLAYLPSPGRVRLRLSARGQDKTLLETEVDRQLKELGNLIGDVISGYDQGETLEKVVGSFLADKKLTLSLAESCTGGRVSQMLTSVAGASKYLKGSVVAYSASSKTQILQVEESVIEKYSVVSKEVAMAMAKGAQRIFNTDYALGITGNAGPEQDDTDAGVGVVFIALVSPQGVDVHEFNFGKPREKVIARAANKSLELLREEILKKGL
jgi:nicotinamide-nucleotide amidase